MKGSKKLTHHCQRSSRMSLRCSWRAYSDFLPVSLRSVRDKKKMDPVASHHVVDVVTQRRGFGADASAETELAVGDEGGPFVVLLACTEGVAINQTANYNETR